MNDDLISREALKNELDNIKQTEYAVKDHQPLFEYVELPDLIKVIDNAPSIETTLKDVISMLSEDSLEATEWLKVDTPSGEEVIFEKRNTGWWLPKKCNLYWYRQFACSKCENEIVCRNVPNYCEKCGAKMKGIYNEQKTADTSL